MMYSLVKYKASLIAMLEAAEAHNIPFEGLVEHKKEFDLFALQAKCAHDPRPLMINKTRLWRCNKCDKFIDNETLSVSDAAKA